MTKESVLERGARVQTKNTALRDAPLDKGLIHGTATQKIVKAYYFSPEYEETWESGALTDTTKYYFTNGMRIAQRSTTQGLQFIHADHLNSSSVLTDASGNVVRRQGYQPYGSDQYVTGTATTTRTFTGYEKDSGGLLYASARYYDPELGRFISADPGIILGVPLSPMESLNAYLYCGNNPVRYTDSTGMEYPDMEGTSNMYTSWWVKPEIRDSTWQPSSAEVERARRAVAGFAYEIASILDPSPTTAAIDMGTALSENDGVGAVVAGLGVIPVLGDVAKGLREGAKLLGVGSDVSKVFSKEKQALIDMAQLDKKLGITPAAMEAYKELNKGLSDPFPKDIVRGPERSVSPGASKAAKQPHGHVGPVDHIPIRGDNPLEEL